MTESKTQNGYLWNDCRWIVFDAVGTLIFPNPSVAEAYQMVAARHGSKASVSEIGERFGTAFRQTESMSFTEDDTLVWRSSQAIEQARWRWMVRQVLPDVVEADQCFADLWEHFASPDSWSCFDEVAACLTAMNQRGIRLAIASNFDSRLHSVRKGHSGLEMIERLFVSSETCFRKPAPEFYSTIIDQLGCHADQILMIGDDPEHDVAGPRAAGMRALLLNRKSQTSTADAIRSLSELI